jgi:hypothetical protein
MVSVSAKIDGQGSEFSDGCSQGIFDAAQMGSNAIENAGVVEAKESGDLKVAVVSMGVTA